jgi:uncharacterized membrane-anchored protein YitT (DUF2179 family)
MKEQEKIKRLVDALKNFNGVLSILSLLSLLAIPLSFMVWIWSTWSICWRMLLTALVALFILQFIIKIVDYLIKEFKEDIATKKPSKSKFQNRLDEMANKDRWGKNKNE